MIKKEIEGKELKQVLHFRFSFEPRFSEVNKSLFLAPSLHTGTTSCNVHYCGPILYDNERETWSKSRVTRTQLNLIGERAHVQVEASAFVDLTSQLSVLMKCTDQNNYEERPFPSDILLSPYSYH
jgi:hypothetical protein